MNFLRQADFFGIPFVQQIDLKQSIYKSAFGGFVTLLIFSASVAYSIWILYLWQINQLSPKISNSIYTSDFKLLDMNYDIIKLYFWKFDEEMIDPFEEKILLPLVMYTTNFSFTQLETLEMSNETSIDGKSKFIIPKMGLAFQEFNGEIYTTTEMYIQIVKCSDIYLKPNEKCASQEIIDKFYNQSLNIVVMQIHYKSLDSKDGSEQASLQEFYIQLEQQNCYTLNTFLQSSFYEIRDSFLFGSPRYVEYINGALIQPQTNSNEYCKLAYENDVLGLIYIIMKGNQVKMIFEYPHAGDLLANIGSIVSVLFMIKYLIIVINQYFLNQTIINQLIELYYPEYKHITIQKNWKRQIKQVKYQNNQIDLKEFISFYQKIHDQMRSKFSFINLLYEISRIQFIIRSTKSRDEFRKSHQIGIKLSFSNEKDLNFSAVKSSFTQRPFSNQLYLIDEEVDILSLTERLREKNDYKIPDELQEQNDFYEINKIT
ncbi:unnamed protein product [Paramecium pentaurelia]|uniref:Transmembrane protein n=1 Tax=Paramecium pentaurelia TaxID=43138 RepID=A0A8S1T0X1_9CILI|nr:unnamed protein product [Paramecium pentaurelia]